MRCVMMFILLILSGVAQAEERVVMSTGTPEKDVAAVQAAVDQGGAVVLRGPFDFGEKGRVTIRRSVSISGDVAGKRADGPATVIKGGFWSFFSPLPAQA